MQNDGLNTSSSVVVNSLTGDGKKGCDLRIAIDRMSLQWQGANGGVVLCALAHLKFSHPDIGDARNSEETKSGAG